MRILITGATGYIGSALAQTLIEQGHRVIGLARSPEAAEALSARGLQVHLGDVSRPESVASILPEVDAVIHVAVGLPRGVTSADFAFVEALIEGLAGSDKLLILTSGLGVYAGVASAHADETTPLAPTIEIQALRVKLEQRVVAAAGQGIRALVLRPAHVYGRGASGIMFRSQLANARQSRTGSMIGDGGVPVATVHIDDLVQAYVAAMDRGRAGRIYNLVSDGVYMRDLAQAVSYAVGGEGQTVSLTTAEAQDAWGPIAALYGASPVISGARAVFELGWKATAPSVLHDLVHGSLRDRSA